MKDESPNGPNQRKSSNTSRHTILLAKNPCPKLSKLKWFFFTATPSKCPYILNADPKELSPSLFLQGPQPLQRSE